MTLLIPVRPRAGHGPRRWRALGAAALLFVLAACQTAELAAPPGLDAGHAVQGRQGWRPGRALAFGEFRTEGAVRNSGVQTRERGSAWSIEGLARAAHTRLQKEQRRLDLTLRDGSGPERQVLVSGSGRLEGELREWSLRLFGVDLGASDQRRQQRFVGTLLPSQGGEALPAWRFALVSPEGDGGRGQATLGWAQRDGDAPQAALAVLPLRGIRSADGRHAAAMPAAAPVPGFEIQREGRALAAVSLLGGGRVWFAPDLDAELRLACAGLAAALLLRQELSD